jgi:DNA-binding beta-propeller fold protein YncE
MVVTDSYDPEVAPREWLAGQAVSTSVSPDGNTLLVLTSGYNRVFQGRSRCLTRSYSSEYIFVFDISNHAPVFKQAIPIPNAYHGIVWDPSGTAFYVSGGMGDAPFGTDPIPYTKNGISAEYNGDNVHIVTQTNGIWAPAAELDLGQNMPPLPLQPDGC